MTKSTTLAKTVAAILAFSLVFMGMPSGTVAASNGGTLAVDVWTDKGGEGPNVPGGQYSVGEETLSTLR